MFAWLRRTKKQPHAWQLKEYDVDVYPSSRSCMKRDMRHVRPQQLPPLMVRKAAWRR